jgi:FkbM family methyltransferase
MTRRFDDALVSLYRVVSRPLGGRGLSRFAVVAGLRDALRSRVSARSAIVNGHRMFLDAADSLNLLGDPAWEPLATKVVRDRVRTGASVVDVGANIGYFTLLLAKTVGPMGMVTAFEPDPRLCALLRRNVMANAYGNVRVRQAAVADASGRLALNVDGGDWGHHLFGERSGAKIEVDVVSLDDALPDAVLDFVKIDTEGAEGHVLHGLRELLRRSPRLEILSEFWPAGLVRAGTDPGAYLAELIALGFRLFDVDEAARKVNMIAPGDLLLKYKPIGSVHTNLLCIRT